MRLYRMSFTSDQKTIVTHLDLLARARKILTEEFARDAGRQLGTSVSAYAQHLDLRPTEDEYVNSIVPRAPTATDFDGGRDVSDWRVPFQRGFEESCPFSWVYDKPRNPGCPELTISLAIDGESTPHIAVEIQFKPFSEHFRSRPRAKQEVEQHGLAPTNYGGIKWTEKEGRDGQTRIQFNSDWIWAATLPLWNDGMALSRRKDTLKTLWPDLAAALESYGRIGRNCSKLLPTGSQNSGKVTPLKRKRTSARLSEEQTFVLQNLAVLSRIEHIWRDGPGEDDSKITNQSLCSITQHALKEMLINRYKGDLQHLRHKNRIKLDGSAQSELGQYVGFSGHSDSSFGILFESDIFPKGPILAFDFRQDFLLEGTLIAVIDLRPWSNKVKKFDRAKQLFDGSPTSRLLRDQLGWCFKGATRKGKFWGYWTQPGQLEIDKGRLVESDAKAIRCADETVKWFIALCESLKNL